MTPLGIYLRKQREVRSITQREMAKGIGVTAAYLSALEHGRRGTPSFALLQRVIGYLNIIWDEADKLQKIAALSDPRVVIDTVEMSAEATELANTLAREIGSMSDEEIRKLLEQLG